MKFLSVRFTLGRRTADHEFCLFIYYYFWSQFLKAPKHFQNKMIENQMLLGVSEPGLLRDWLICCCLFSSETGSASCLCTVVRAHFPLTSPVPKVFWEYNSFWTLDTDHVAVISMFCCVFSAVFHDTWQRNNLWLFLFCLLPQALHLVDVPMFQKNVVHLITDLQTFDQHKAQVSGLEVPCEKKRVSTVFQPLSFYANAPWL